MFMAKISHPRNHSSQIAVSLCAFQLERELGEGRPDLPARSLFWGHKIRVVLESHEHLLRELYPVFQIAAVFHPNNWSDLSLGAVAKLYLSTYYSNGVTADVF